MAASKIIVSTSAAVTVDGPISAMEKHEFILQDAEYTRKSTLIVDDVGTGMAIETAKSCMKVEPADDSRMVMVVESSYKLMPVPSVEAQEIAETHEKIIAETSEMGAANFKVKLD